MFFRYGVTTLVSVLIGLLNVANVHAFEVKILSATVKDEVISGVNATLQKNGQASLRVQSDAQGRVKFDSAAIAGDAETLLILKKEGYSNLVVKCPCDGLTYAMSTKMTNLDGLRVVLNWGSSPEDLDSHIVYPGNHIYFDQKTGQAANLDVDDTNSYGPETITVNEKIHGERYVYAVHNYSDQEQARSVGLSNSQIKVMVYVGETLIKTYTAKPNVDATLWVLFAIDGEGDFQTIDQYTHANSPKKVGQYLREVMLANNVYESTAVSTDNISLAEGLNEKGEAKYHQQAYSEAVDFFQQAIELWPNYGQAYSNLGLTFQKAGRVAEAIWANRKAIALASGEDKSIVQASSYYNIARIYESESQWAKAQQNFEFALSKRQHSAYTKGIARMKKKLVQQ